MVNTKRCSLDGFLHKIMEDMSTGWGVGEEHGEEGLCGSVS